MEQPDLFPNPGPNFFLDHPERRWPAWKFDMELNDLFTTLPCQFNSMTLPMLDADAFSRDISELSHLAHDRADFIRLLAERRDSRQRELQQVWLCAFREIATSPGLLGNDSAQWAHAMHIYRSKSFDAYVRYFAGFLLSTTSGPALAQDINPRSLPPTASKSTSGVDASTASTASTSASPTDPTSISSEEQGAPSTQQTLSTTAPTQLSIPGVEQHAHTQKVSNNSRSGRPKPSTYTSGKIEKSRRRENVCPRRSKRIMERDRRAKSRDIGRTGLT